MKSNVLIAAALLAMTGCTPQSTPPAVTDAAVPAPAQAPEAAACAPAGYQLLPAGIALSIPYHLRADRIYSSKDGQSRRRIVLEYLDSDAGAVLASVESSMLASGFKARPRRDQPNGNIVVPYLKRDFGNLQLVLNPSPGDKPSNPAAKGTLALDFPFGDTVAATVAAASH
jgi:hypothetical protein